MNYFSLPVEPYTFTHMRRRQKIQWMRYTHTKEIKKNIHKQCLKTEQKNREKNQRKLKIYLFLLKTTTTTKIQNKRIITT